jgi:hypothetical protein
MQYLSEFEILSEPIVPQALAPGVTLPFVAQGYFVLVSRLADNLAEILNVRLTFFPSIPFPPATSLLVDYEDGAGNNNVAALAADNTVSFPVGSGQTVLFGIQPDVVNTAAGGPLGTGTFGSRGYVVIDTAPNQSATANASFQLAVVPEIRSTFFSVSQPAAGGPVTPDFAGASEVAYVLPTSAGPLITVSKNKESKEKEASKDTKESKDTKDRKDVHPDKIPTKDLHPDKPVPDKNPPELPQAQPQGAGIANLSQRVAALEEMVGGASAFITPDQRPKVG